MIRFTALPHNYVQRDGHQAAPAPNTHQPATRLPDTRPMQTTPLHGNTPGYMVRDTTVRSLSAATFRDGRAGISLSRTYDAESAQAVRSSPSAPVGDRGIGGRKGRKRHTRRDSPPRQRDQPNRGTAHSRLLETLTLHQNRLSQIGCMIRFTALPHNYVQRDGHQAAPAPNTHQPATRLPDTRPMQTTPRARARRARRSRPIVQSRDVRSQQPRQHAAADLLRGGLPHLAAHHDFSHGTLASPREAPTRGTPPRTWRPA